MTFKAIKAEYTDDFKSKWQRSVEVSIECDGKPCGTALMTVGVQDCNISYAEECDDHGLIDAWPLGDDWIDFDLLTLAGDNVDDLHEVAVNAAVAFHVSA